MILYFLVGLIIILISIIVWLNIKYIIPIQKAKKSLQIDQDFTRVSNEFTEGDLAEILNFANSRIQSKSQEVAQISKSLDTFAYVVSHDLKGPFNTIKSISELLKIEYYDKFDDGGKELLHFIDLKVEEMDRLLAGILTYSRVRAAVDTAISIDLNYLIQEITTELGINTEKVKIECQLPIIKLEKNLAHLLFKNIIENAILYSSNEDMPIEISCASDQNFYTFSIKDYGIGIQQRYFEKIFNIYFKIKEVKTESETAGIGLSVAKKIVEMKGGTIWLESEYQKGSIFYFTLPAGII